MALHMPIKFTGHTAFMPLLQLLRLLPATLLGCTCAVVLAQADAPAFAVLEFEVVGNTVLPVAAVERAVLPHLGPGKRLADVEEARASLEQAYQAAGYLTVLVDIPEQRVDAGVVQLRVLEGRVDRLAVTGARWYDQGMIRQRLPQFAPGEVPNFQVAQQQMAALGRDERQVQPVLKPGAWPGTVDVELKVADKAPGGVSLELHNRHGAGSAAWRAVASGRWDNLFQRDHGLSATAITAPEDPRQSRVFTLNYAAPLQGGRSLVVHGTWSDSTLEPFGAATVLGRGFTLGARWVHNAASGDALHTLSLGADYKDLKERITAGAGSADISTPLRYLPFTAQYSGSWFGSPRTQLSTSFTAAFGPLLARTVQCPDTVVPIDQFACKREGGTGSFALWRGDLRHTRGLPLGLPGTATLRLGWQVATAPLPGGEQYAAGGADSVRGYYEAEGTGDHALLGSLEWRSPNLWPRPAQGGASPIDELSLLAYLDAARVHVNQPAAGQAARVPLLGAGLGLRLRALQRLSADIDLAWPQKPTAASPRSTPRLHVRLGAQF
jgi:hemolysin activation/secretion protein